MTKKGKCDAYTFTHNNIHIVYMWAWLKVWLTVSLIMQRKVRMNRIRNCNQQLVANEWFISSS